MLFSREEIEDALRQWNLAWDRHDLDGVMRLFHDEIVFENWTGERSVEKERSGRRGRPGLQIMGDFDL